MEKSSTNFVKAYTNEKTPSTIYKSLKAAHLANKSAYVYRVWLNLATGELHRTTILAYGDQICSVKHADEQIAKEIESTK